MCMDEFVKRLYDFRGIYIIFWSQNSHYRYFTDIYQYFFRNSNTLAHEIKFRNFAEISRISDISTIFPIFSDFWANQLSVDNFVSGLVDN